MLTPENAGCPHCFAPLSEQVELEPTLFHRLKVLKGKVRIDWQGEELVLRTFVARVRRHTKKCGNVLVTRWPLRRLLKMRRRKERSKSIPYEA